MDRNILVEVLVFTCGTVRVLFCDIAGSTRAATSATENIFILKVEDSMPDRAPWMSRMRSGQAGVSTGCGKKKQERSTKTVSVKCGHWLAFHQGFNEGK